MSNFKLFAIYYITLILGLVSQILYAVFSFSCPFSIFNYGFSFNQALLFDAGLVLLFFLQHSLLVRKSVKEKFSRLFPEELHGAFYSNTSAIAIFIMIILWQSAPMVIFSAEGIFYWIMRTLFAVSLAGFYAGVKSLDAFDPYGVKNIKRLIYKKEQKKMPMTVRGAYRWMRHPLYFFMLLMIWSSPVITADRLLFNVSFTIWIFLGTVMEERDLVACFGDQYRNYREKVPMIIPCRIPRNRDEF